MTTQLNVFHISAIAEMNEAFQYRDLQALTDLRSQMETTTVFGDEKFRQEALNLCDTLIKAVKGA